MHRQRPELYKNWQMTKQQKLKILRKNSNGKKWFPLTKLVFALYDKKRPGKNFYVVEATDEDEIKLLKANPDLILVVEKPLNKLGKELTRKERIENTKTLDVNKLGQPFPR